MIFMFFSPIAALGRPDSGRGSLSIILTDPGKYSWPYHISFYGGL